MFNLLVTAGEGVWDGSSYALEKVRFLEYTDKDLVAQFKDLGDAAVATLRQLPALFAYEADVAEPARVGWIKTIQDRGLNLGISYAFDSAIAPIDPEQIVSLGGALGLGRLEMNRTHWALKRGRLLAVLRSAGLAPESAVAAEQPEFMFSRGTVIAVCDALQKLGHGGLDRFLMEMGISGIDAGREQGGLLPRVNALAKFVLSHKDLRTADGHPIEAAIVTKAADADPMRAAKFWVSLERDGYTVSDAAIVPVREEVVPPYSHPSPPKVAPPLVPAPPPKIVGSVAGTSAFALSRPVPAAPSASDAAPPPRSVTPNGTRPPKVFVVHGRDHGAKKTVARYLERLGLEAVILHERSNQGRTLISKFQEESADVKFAVVLMTPDDVGGLKPDAGAPKLKDRARQNVVFESGSSAQTRSAPWWWEVRGGVRAAGDPRGYVVEASDAAADVRPGERSTRPWVGRSPLHSERTAVAASSLGSRKNLPDLTGGYQRLRGAGQESLARFETSARGCRTIELSHKVHERPCRRDSERRGEERRQYEAGDVEPSECEGASGYTRGPGRPCGRRPGAARAGESSVRHA